MPKKRFKRRSRRTLYWAWPAHLEPYGNGRLLLALWSKQQHEQQIRVRVTRV